MGIIQEIKLGIRDFRRFIFEIPKTRYQFWDKVFVIALVIFPIILIFFIILMRG